MEPSPEARLSILVALVALLGLVAIVVLTLLLGAWRRQILRDRMREDERRRAADRAAGLPDTWAEAANRLPPEVDEDG